MTSATKGSARATPNSAPPSGGPARPALGGEWVNGGTSSGYAVALGAEPADDSSCPACSRTKSRLRRSGTSDIAPTIALLPDRVAVLYQCVVSPLHRRATTRVQCG